MYPLFTLVAKPDKLALEFVVDELKLLEASLELVEKG